MAILLNTNTGLEITLLVQHIFGRHPVNSNTQLFNRDASRTHAAFFWEQETWYVKDLGSANGTYINGERMVEEKKHPIRIGDTLRFGNLEAEIWEITDLSPPQCTLTPLSEGLPTILLNDIVALPSEDNPEITLYQSKEGQWVCEGPQGTFALKSGEAVRTRENMWRFVDCNPSQETYVFEDASTDVSDNLSFHFKVSQNEEHVSVTIKIGPEEFDLGERTHHYLILFLARKHLTDASAGIDPDECGWINKEMLSQMLGLSEYHINIHVFRFRKQLHKALPKTHLINQTIERRSGEVRFYYNDIYIEGGQ